jgi:xanthine dehydrogenase accessory factor
VEADVEPESRSAILGLVTLVDELATRDAWAARGKRVAAATVIAVHGTAPRPTGTRMLVSSDGEAAGSISAGCVEPQVIDEAMGVLASDEPKVVAFGISDEDAFAVGLACGGSIEVLIEPW